MSEQINDGGPAYPTVREYHHGGGTGREHVEGKSLRADFAGRAMNGIVANEYLVQTCIAMAVEGRTTPEAVMAQRAVKIADALIKELQKP